MIASFSGPPIPSRPGHRGEHQFTDAIRLEGGCRRYGAPNRAGMGADCSGPGNFTRRVLAQKKMGYAGLFRAGEEARLDAVDQPAHPETAGTDAGDCVAV